MFNKLELSNIVRKERGTLLLRSRMPHKEGVKCELLRQG